MSVLKASISLCSRTRSILSKQSQITTCIPRDDDVSRDLDIIKKEIIGNPELKLRMLLRQIDDLQIPIEKSDKMKHIHVPASQWIEMPNTLIPFGIARGLIKHGHLS